MMKYDDDRKYDLWTDDDTRIVLAELGSGFESICEADLTFIKNEEKFKSVSDILPEFIERVKPIRPTVDKIVFKVFKKLPERRRYADVAPLGKLENVFFYFKTFEKI